jgi:phenylalanyl-tRNA synthetase beta chain
MKISESWLREWVNPAITTEQLTHTLTMAGLEVDGVEPAAAEFSGVVVGEIQAVEAHPDAEKLRVCSVSDGSETFQVVCGASNAAVNLRVPFAKVGAELAEGLKIKAAKLRGVESSGMLCGGSELGLEDIVDGLMVLPADAPLGISVREYLNLDDSVIEVDLTPNRGDCLSVLGVAREVGVLSSTDLKLPPLTAIEKNIDDAVAVNLLASEYCPRYASRILRNVNMSAETPIWMREKLRRAGVRSIDPVVDVTNYVMLELGQPLHAFDLASVEGDITVRMAQQGEKIKLLDGSEQVLDDSMLLIADNKKPLALGGIMGGESSAVSASSKDILLESAFFEPTLHAGKARKIGMHTDASHRFERGVDRLSQERAIERATALLLDIVGGDAGPVVLAQSNSFSSKLPGVHLPESQIARVLGFNMPQAQVSDIFQRLGLSPVSDDNGWTISVPSHRFDIAIEADLLEELARIYGYDRLPVEPPLAPMEFSLKPESHIDTASFRSQLVALGYREAITYSFIDPEQHSTYFNDVTAVALVNPIASDMSVMRSSLIPGLVNAADYNLSRQQRRLRLFETGLGFIPGDNGVEQVPLLAGLICGDRLPESWLSKNEATQATGQKADQFDFFDIKADLEAVLAMRGGLAAQGIEFNASQAQQQAPWLHPGQSAAVLINGGLAGFVGQIHPQIAKTLGISTTIWLFELKLALISGKKVPEFKELSKFPEVRRDLAVIVDQQFSVGEVVAVARQAAGNALVGLVIFDHYSGEHVGDGKQSIGLALTWQHRERTLHDEEIATLTEGVIAALREQFNATLR